MKLVIAASAALLTFAGLGVTAHADTTVAPPPIMSGPPPPPPVTASLTLDPNCISDIIATDACYACLDIIAVLQEPVVGDLVDGLLNGKHVCGPVVIHP